jgi:hypothetical protein
VRVQVAAGIVAVALAGGVGAGAAVRGVREPAAPRVAVSSTSAPTPTPTARTTKKAAPAPQQPVRTSAAPQPKPQLQTLSSMKIGAGSIGPVAVGITSDAAVASGYFDDGVEACGGGLQWKTDYAAVLDVGVTGGVVTSLGVRAPGPTTLSGLGVGSTYASVRQVVGEGVVPEPVGAGSGVFVADGAAWIGLLLDGAPDALTDTSTVTYVEVSRGARPDLVRGC